MAATSLPADASSRLLFELRERARSARLLDRSPSRYAGRALLLGPPLALLLCVAWTHSSSAVGMLAAGTAGILCIQLGFIAHDAGHGVVARAQWVNALAGHLAFTLLNGLGFESWRTSHAAHHAGCQDESRDPDMWVDTVMSLTPRSAVAKTGLGRRLLPYQAFTLWPLALFFAHSQRVESLGRCYREPLRYRSESLLLPLHYGLWLVLPALLLGAGWGRSLAVYAVTSAVMGLYLAVIFWTNHVGMPVLQAGHGRSIAEQQVVGSRNVRCLPVFDWFFGGLNFQIEHHLVPDCPGARLRELRAITRPLCAEAALPYREEGLLQALRSVTRHVRDLAQHADYPAAASVGLSPEVAPRCAPQVPSEHRDEGTRAVVTERQGDRRDGLTGSQPFEGSQ